MLAMRYIVLCMGVLAVSLRHVNGLSDDERSAIKGLVMPFVAECAKDYGVSEDEIKAAKEAGSLKDLDPCLLSCVLKKIGLFNDKGMFDEAKASELTTKFLNGEDEQKQALGIIHTCSSVNDQSVGDGDKGCERAKLLFDCYIPLKGSLPGTP